VVSIVVTSCVKRCAVWVCSASSRAGRIILHKPRSAQHRRRVGHNWIQIWKHLKRDRIQALALPCFPEDSIASRLEISCCAANDRIPSSPSCKSQFTIRNHPGNQHVSQIDEPPPTPSLSPAGVPSVQNSAASRTFPTWASLKAWSLRGLSEPAQRSFDSLLCVMKYEFTRKDRPEAL
jgi:hypothetical protein